MSYNHVLGALTAFLTLVSSPAFAQQWTAKAKIANGNCGDGATVEVVEQGEAMVLKFSLNGKQFTEVRVALAADGSGKTIFTGATEAQTTLDIPAGTGKRQLKTAQTRGVCQWLWN